MTDILQLIATVIALYALFFNASQVRLLREQNEQIEKKARQRATIDLALHERTDQIFIECKAEFLRLRDLAENDPNQSLTLYACHLNNYQHENTVLSNYLNHYEFLACGIFEEALDGEIYKRMRRSSVIRDWEDLKPYVMELRNQRKNDRIYCELEKLVESWK